MPSFTSVGKVQTRHLGVFANTPQGAASPVASAGLGFFDRDVWGRPIDPLPVLGRRTRESRRATAVSGRWSLGRVCQEDPV